MFAEHGRPLTETDYYGTLAGLSEETIIGTWLDVRRRRARGARRGAHRALSRPQRGTGRPSPERFETRSRTRPIAFPSPSSPGAFRREIEPVLAGAGLRRRVAVLVAPTTSSTGSRTPRATCARSLRSTATCTRDEVVAFEDTEAGVASAKAAGLHCVRVLGTHAAERLRVADELVEAIDVELVRRLARMTFVIAHRGACWELPENTLAAFERAIELGADYVELDVHAAADGSLVVCHDRPRGGELRLEEAVDVMRGTDRDHVRAEDPVALSPSRRGPSSRRAHFPRTPSSSPSTPRARRRAGTARAPARRLRRLHPRSATVRLGRRLPRPASHAAGAREGPRSWDSPRPSIRSTTPPGCASCRARRRRDLHGSSRSAAGRCFAPVRLSSCALAAGKLSRTRAPSGQSARPLGGEISAPVGGSRVDVHPSHRPEERVREDLADEPAASVRRGFELDGLGTHEQQDPLTALLPTRRVDTHRRARDIELATFGIAHRRMRPGSSCRRTRRRTACPAHRRSPQASRSARCGPST